jgi:hypothetical protein
VGVAQPFVKPFASLLTGAALLVLLATQAPAAGALGPGLLAVFPAKGGVIVVDAQCRTQASALDAAVSSSGGLALLRQASSPKGPTFVVELRRLGQARGKDVATVSGDVAPELAFSDDGRLLAVASRSGIRLVTVANGQSRLLPLPQGAYSAVAFSHDAKQLVAFRTTGAAGAGTGKDRLLLVTLADGQARTVYTIKHIPAAPIARPEPLFSENDLALVFIKGQSALVTMGLGNGQLFPLVKPRPGVRLTHLIAAGKGYVFARSSSAGVADVWKAENGESWRLTKTVAPKQTKPGSALSDTTPLALAPAGDQLLLAHGLALDMVPVAGGPVQALCAPPTASAPAVRAAWQR